MDAGISSYTFPWAIGISGNLPTVPMDVDGLIKKAAEWNIRHVQIADNFSLQSLSTENLNNLWTQINEFGITLELGTRGLMKDNLLNHLKIAQFLHSPFLRVVIDDVNFHPSPDDVKVIIKEVLPNFQRAGIKLALENHDRFPAIQFADIIKGTDPDWVGICLDTANSLGCGEGINEIVPILGPYTINLHIKDFTIRRVSTKMGFVVEGSQAGKGLLDIPRLIEEIDSYKKCQTATLEIWSNFKNNITETIKLEAQMAELSIHYLKKFTTG